MEINKDDLASIGQRISLLRKQQNMTQTDLSKVLNVPRELISYWEKGTRDIKVAHLIQLAPALHTTTDYLLGLSNVSTSNYELQSICRYTALSQNSVEQILHHKNYIETTSAVIESEEFWNIIYILFGAKKNSNLLSPSNELTVHRSQYKLDNTVPDAISNALLAVIQSGLTPFYKQQLTEQLFLLFDNIAGKDVGGENNARL